MVVLMVIQEKVIWCRASYSNNDPKIVAGYYLQAAVDTNLCPRVIRADNGTENVSVADMQRFLRRNHNDSLSGEKSFRYGTSCLNQRIEFWWGILRKECIQFWMDLLSNLKEDHLYTGSWLDKNLVRFCFINLVQSAIDQTVDEWNSHSIRKSKSQRVPNGVPNILFNHPELSGSDENGVDFNEEDLLACADEATFISTSSDKDISELCVILMEENNWQSPTSPHDALTLYYNLRQSCNNML